MIMNPSAIKHVVLDGHSLTLESFVAVAQVGTQVSQMWLCCPSAFRPDVGPRVESEAGADSALEAMKKSRALAEKIAEEGRVAYGMRTRKIKGGPQKEGVPSGGRLCFSSG